ncbi:adenosylcobinamide-GDP ribazoletransferase [Caldalkalibacillus mannanilyticus]|uniref:adenosylcobinamide-GDP ribazoletransferase n=1 Tax=Caldalkalibacillus mannanilyticus TaxID=1418 RepID=UPI001F1F4C38|nr:adenosylcobinamide-GDP ribazoletransferase [Caldalkalibacillus mannanilyticus]
MIRGFILSIQFLTSIPFPFAVPWNQQTMRWALGHFSTVGLVIGAILTALYLLLPGLIPTWLLGLALLSGWLMLTGGLHVDGLMDIADAIGSNAPLEKKWEIMKDPHVGSFGMIALFLVLGWKLGLLVALIEITHVLPILLLFIPVLARFGTLLLLYWMPLAKQQGLAWEWKKGLSIHGMILSLVPLVVLVLISPSIFALLFLSYGIYLLGYALWIMYHLKGLNGDVLGASIEGGELWLLLVSYIWFAMV